MTKVERAIARSVAENLRMRAVPPAIIEDVVQLAFAEIFSRADALEDIGEDAAVCEGCGAFAVDMRADIEDDVHLCDDCATLGTPGERGTEPQS